MDTFLRLLGLERKRRGSQRARIDWPVDLQTHQEDSYLAFSGKDISIDGVSIEGSLVEWNELGTSRNTPGRIRIRVPIPGHPIEADAILKWELKKDDDTTTGWEFIQLEHEDLQFIEAYVKEHAAN
jgi:hypothetical protein